MQHSTCKRLFVCFFMNLFVLIWIFMEFLLNIVIVVGAQNGEMSAYREQWLPILLLFGVESKLNNSIRHNFGRDFFHLFFHLHVHARPALFLSLPLLHSHCIWNTHFSVYAFDFMVVVLGPNWIVFFSLLLWLCMRSGYIANVVQTNGRKNGFINI